MRRLGSRFCVAAVDLPKSEENSPIVFGLMGGLMVT
jgi:hypothetical protein